MKTLVILVAVAAVVVAEAPLSHSYLPPSPANRDQGFQQNFGAPQVVAARTIDHGHVGNGIARTSTHDQATQARLGQHQGYDDSSATAAFLRNSIDANSEPANYNFGYMVNDYSEGTDFGHHEERLEEKAQGEYHVVLPDGRKQTVSYEADERGFKPQISYQETQDLARSNGYDSANPHVQGGYDATARNHGNGYDATTRNQGNGYDATARNHGNGFKNSGHGDHDSRGTY